MIPVSIIIPAYNEEKTIVQNMTRLVDSLDRDGIEFRLMLVDDGSVDGTWLSLRSLAEKDSRISCLHFARNFGKEAAIFAGLKAMGGQRFLVMDSDLQHPPRYIGEMIRQMDETGADIIDGVKADRGEESLAYKLLARSFYKLLEAVSGLKLNSSSDFKLMNRKVVDAINQLPEGKVFFRGVVDWVGFDKVEFPFKVDSREGDVSRFSTKRLIRFAIDSVLAYTSAPLYFSVVTGLLSLLAAFVTGVVLLIKACTGGALTGTALLALLILFMGGCLLMSAGALGAYLSRIYDEVKGRPRYVVSEIVGDCGK